MGFVNFIIELLKDPRAAIAGWIAMGVAPTLGFIFLIVFIETGVVFFPFLPGDSLLFAAGVFAAPDAATGKAALPLFWLLPVVWCAPIIGDQCNYFIGHFFGRRIIQSGKVKALTPERLAKTEGMLKSGARWLCSWAASSRSFVRSCRSFPVFPVCVGAVSRRSQCSAACAGPRCSRCWATSSATFRPCRITSNW